jgi:TolA-binding protein
VELYISQGKEEQALATADEMRRFWRSSRLSAATRFRLATYLEEAGETERALKAFGQIAEQDPESAEAQMSLLKIGQLQLSAVGDARSAAATLSGFLDRYPASEWRTFAADLLSRAKEALL